MAAILNEHTQYLDASGRPLAGGSIYIGDVNADPVANPKAIFSDRELTVALTNPQTLDANGRATNKIWTSGKHSLQVNDINAVQVFQDLDRGESEITIDILNDITGVQTSAADNDTLIITRDGVQSNITAANFKLPLATLTGAETLTNKTLTTPTLTTPVINGTITGDVILAEAAWETGTATTPAIPTPANIAAAIAALTPTTAGAIGTYCFARCSSGDRAFGATVSGSALVPTSAAYSSQESNSVGFRTSDVGSVLSGTWQCMGTFDDVFGGSGIDLRGATLWLRIA